MASRVAAVQRLLFRNNTATTGTRTPYQQGMVKRITEQQVSVESVNLRAHNKVKKNQAWRYKDGVVDRASTTVLDQRQPTKHYTDPKSDGLPRRRQESNFFLTINTNQDVRDPARYEIGQEYMANMLKILSTDKSIARYLTFGPRDEATYKDDKYSAVISNIDWQANVEIGPQKARLHAHVWLTVTHYSQIQINVRALQHEARVHYNAVADDSMRMKALPYVHVKLLPQSNWTSIMRQYIHKAMEVK